MAQADEEEVSSSDDNTTSENIPHGQSKSSLSILASRESARISKRHQSVEEALKDKEFNESGSHMKG